MSEEKNKKEDQEKTDESKDANEPNMKKAFKTKLEKKDEEIASLKEEVEKWKNEYYRAYADMTNLRKSLEKDYNEAKRYRAEGFIENLLPVLDSFHVALSNSPSDPAIKNYLIGFEYIYKNMVSAMENEGCIELLPKIGENFDPSTMHAVDTQEGEDENKVVKVLSVGVKLHDRIIKPAMVIVSKKIDPSKKENKTSTEEKVDA